MTPRSHRATRRARRADRSLACLVGTGLAALAPAALAFDIDTGLADGKLVWDTTLKYSNAWRTRGQSDAILNDPAAANQDDGDRNFKRGLVSNRLDLFTEADFTYQNFGARVSGAAWYDSVYNRSNDNNSPATNNSLAGPNTFPVGTRNIMGRKGELLDAFVSAKADLGDMPASVRLGRHALQWGETLFFGNNGIAGTMAPVDAVKAALIPNSLVREIIRPVGQLSGQIQLTPAVLLGAYYQYKWEKTRIPPAGSYFSGGDFFDDGGEQFFGGPGPGLPRSPDIKPSNHGQFGAQLKFRDATNGVDYGLYAIRYHAKAFTTSYLNFGLIPLAPPPAPPVALPVSYQLAYAQNIKTFGGSFSFTSGDYQWAGEVSTRRDTPLYTTSLPVSPGAVGNNTSDPGYAVGNTAHVNLSVIASIPSSFIARSANLLAEVAWNRTLSVTKNPQLVYPTTSRDGLSMRAVFIPTYSQVLDGLDLDVPVGLSYSPQASSSAVPNFGVRKGGDMSIGLKGTFRNAWNIGLTYQHFYGPAGNTLVFVPGSPAPVPTFNQALADRDFLSFSVSTTF